LGDILNLGDTPRPLAGSILHLFFSNDYHTISRIMTPDEIIVEFAEIFLINSLCPPILGHLF
jgi:hypothetical protein